MSVFGVDFGNLNSTVAITRYGGVDIVTNEVSKRETTTIVSFLEDERFIGEQGLDRYVRNAQNTIFLLKRFIGMRMDDPNLEIEKRFLTCAVEGDNCGRLMFAVNYCNDRHFFYPEQVLAMMLQKLRSYVNEAATVDPRFPADVKDCVITVPSFYTAEQRRLIYQASEVAGLHCMSLINEATAAAVDYGIFRGTSLKETEEEAQVVGILDIGYGTTDFTIAKFWKGNCKIVARAYDRNTGTRDMDYELFQHMVQEVQARYKVNVNENKRARLRLLQACERLKYLLSANQKAPLTVENVMDIDVNIPSFERAIFEEVIANVVNRIKCVVERGIQECGEEISVFHSIEMIGGGCRIPIVKKMVEEVLGKAPSFTLNASETTARGAAITAAMLSPKFQVREFKVAELASYPIMLGYYIQKAKVPCSISFLPDINKAITLLGAQDRYPKLLDVTIPRTAPFKFYAFYDAENCHVQEMISPSQYVIGEWDVAAPSTSSIKGEPREVRLRISIRPDGLLHVETAWLIATQEVEEEVDGEKDPANPEAEVPKVVKKKTLSNQIEISVTPNLEIIGHPSESVLRFRKTESEMHQRDVQIIRTREKKNELESYILNYRPRIAPGGDLAEYVTPELQQSFTQQCDQDEQWLYEDGEHASYEAYDERVKALRLIGDSAAQRHKIRDDVNFAINGFLHKMELLKQNALGMMGKAAHITNEELQNAAKSVEEAMAWAKQEVHTLNSLPKCQDGNFTTRNLDDKLKSLTKSVNAVINRPAPPPPPPKKESTSKTSSPTANSPNTSNEAKKNNNSVGSENNKTSTAKKEEVGNEEEEEEAATAVEDKQPCCCPTELENEEEHTAENEKCTISADNEEEEEAEKEKNAKMNANACNLDFAQQQQQQQQRDDDLDEERL